MPHFPRRPWSGSWRGTARRRRSSSSPSRRCAGACRTNADNAPPNRSPRQRSVLALLWELNHLEPSAAFWRFVPQLWMRHMSWSLVLCPSWFRCGFRFTGGADSPNRCPQLASIDACFVVARSGSAPRLAAQQPVVGVTANFAAVASHVSRYAFVSSEEEARRFTPKATPSVDAMFFI